MSTPEPIDPANQGIEPALAEFTRRISLELAGATPELPSFPEVAVRVRSTREPRPAILRQDGTGATIELLSAEDGVSPGQACVIYENDDPRARVLGGGTIARTLAEAAPAAA